ncbi:unnamed protein product [Gongylonema pulchrum]|uniref:Homeobox protein A2 n=1 Tax=Gongylonema pulchrum TaxID=637853 RepID=A0A183EP72_9BILA|nr:unnamed protein product [Gongylonema pulchrum]
MGPVSELISEGLSSPEASPSYRSTESCQSSSPELKFSIQNILRPDFGKHEPVAATPKPCTSTTPDNMNVAFPAWIYCTRYSDRPSSGNFSQTSEQIFTKTIICHIVYF